MPVPRQPCLAKNANPVVEPYLNQRADINWPKGAVRQSVLKLKRGVPVHGTIPRP